MVEAFKTNTAKYLEYFAQAAEELMPKRQKPVNPDDVPPSNSGIQIQVLEYSQGATEGQFGPAKSCNAGRK